MEKLVYKRLISFINDHNLLYNKQFGFRSQHSSELAILLITDRIQRAFEKGLYGAGIFLDLSKAFDTVNHHLLLQKLEHYGIRDLALNWFNSYLTKRKQYVSLGNVKSDLLEISCGVPQGSVLGPLLFLLYINDFSNSSKKLDFHIFADDSNLFYTEKCLLSLEREINSELISIHNWLIANKLVLNIEKSNVVIFHPPQKKLSYNINVSINNKSIEIVRNTKYLGVFIDSNLNWKDQVTYLAKKIRRNIAVLSKLRHFVNSKILTNLYYSLIYPFLIYGIVAWGNTYSTTTRPLFIFQKKALRIINNSRYDDHTGPIFKAKKILKLEDLIYFCNGNFMYDYHHKKLPEVFDSFFTKVDEVHSYNTRLASKSSFALPKAK